MSFGYALRLFPIGSFCSIGWFWYIGFIVSTSNHRLSLEIRNMEKLKNITPGEILLEEFLIPLGISQYRLSKDLEIPQTRVSEIIKGNRRISADTAVRLSAYFGNSAKFWLGLQDDYDIENEMSEKSNEVNRIIKIRKEKAKNIA